MKKHNSKKKTCLTRNRIIIWVISLVVSALVVLTLCFLIAIRTNHDNASNQLLVELFNIAIVALVALVVIFAFVIITYRAKTSLNSNETSYETKTALSMSDTGFGIKHEEKIAK